MKKPFILFAAILLPILLSAQSSVTKTIRNYRIAHEREILSEFIQLLSIPNVASDTPNIKKNADLIVKILQQRGITARLIEHANTPPAVYGELKTDGATRTIGLYVHYDGQPVDTSQWATEPWKPVLRDNTLDAGGKELDLNSIKGGINPEWRLYARSTGDDKAPIIAIAAALDAMKEAGIKPSVNLKFFFEGEEEAGSERLPEVMEQHKDLLKADLWFLCDGPVHQTRNPQLFFGARGVMGLEMSVYGPARALHSGHYGNWAPNPIALLTNLLASMRDSDGKILVAGFYEEVRPLSELEKKAIADAPKAEPELRKSLALAQTEADGAPLVERTISIPAMNLRGIQGGQVGEKAANAIPVEAHASIDIRLVPDQKPDRIRMLVEEHIRKQGYHIVHETPDLETRRMNERVIKLEWVEGYPAARTPLDLPVSQAVVNTIEKSFSTSLIKMPSLGGSIPMYLFIEKLEAPVIGLPIANHDNNQHAANENIRLQNLWDGIELFAVVFAELGNNWK